jgi:hypothetical protein
MTMQKRLLLLFFSIFIGMLFLVSCTSDTLVPENINPTQTISYAADIQPIFSASCVGCHAGTTLPDLREGKSFSSLASGNYIKTSAPEQSVLYVVMAPNGSMASYTNVSESQLVLQWIRQGAKNN